MSSRCLAALLALVLVSSAALLAAEGVARVTGSLVDGEGNAVGGVEIVFYLVPAGGAAVAEPVEKVRVKSRKNGKFTVGNFPAGTYYAMLDDETWILERLALDGRAPDGSRVPELQREGDADSRGASPPFQLVTGLRADLTLTLSQDRSELEQYEALEEAKDASGKLQPLNELFQQQNWSGLLAQSDAVLAEDPELGGAVYLRAVALWRSGRVAEAVDAMRRAAELIPDQPAIAGTMGSLLLEQGNALRAAGKPEQAQATYAEAADFLNKQLEETPDAVTYLTNRVIALEAAGKLGQAIAAIDALIAADPGNARYYLRKAEIQTELGLSSAAVETIAGMPPGAGKDAAEVLYNAAVEMWNQGNMEGVIATTGKAIELAPDMPLLYRLKGRAHISHGQDAEGIATLRKYLSMVPADDPEAEADRALVEALGGGAQGGS